MGRGGTQRAVTKIDSDKFALLESELSLQEQPGGEPKMQSRPLENWIAVQKLRLLLQTGRRQR